MDEDEAKSGLGALLSGENSPLASIAALIPSLSDEYFKMKNRELDLKEKALSKRSAAPGARRVKKTQGNGQLDLSDPKQVEEYFKLMAQVSESDFNAELARVKEHQPELFEMVRAEFGLNENGEPEEEEELEEEEEQEEEENEEV